MDRADVVVGQVGKPHGLDGSFFVDAASDDPAWFAVGAELRVGDRIARVVESKRSRGRPVIRLDVGVPRGTELAVPRAALPPTRDDEYYVADLIGLVVEEHAGPELGRVIAVEPYEANDVLELDSGVTLPMIEECVQEIDLERGRIVVTPGFLDAR